MKVTNTINNQNPSFKAFKADKDTARLINRQITNIIPVRKNLMILGLNESDYEKYINHYITPDDKISYFADMLERTTKKDAQLSMTEYFKNLLDNAKEVKYEDVEKFAPEMQAAKDAFRKTEDKIKKALNLEA